jgi:asparagine N-glycosylation enzyme membrane subunit Stt3
VFKNAGVLVILPTPISPPLCFFPVSVFLFILFLLVRGSIFLRIPHLYMYMYVCVFVSLCMCVCVCIHACM